MERVYTRSDVAQGSRRLFVCIDGFAAQTNKLLTKPGATLAGISSV